MNYIAEIKAFYDIAQVKQLSTGQIALWHALMYINNKCAWIEWFSVSNIMLEINTGLTRDGIAKARNILKQKELIDFKSNGTKATSYKLNSIANFIQDSIQGSMQDSIQDSMQSSMQNSTTLNKQNKTKLNEFNLYNNFSQNVQCDCISKSTKQKCMRRSTYCINGKNYCNQHSKNIISKLLTRNNDINKKYGEYGNVFFNDEEFEKLKAEFPNDYQERIQKLDDYMQSTGKKYKDCLATIRNWAKKDGYKQSYTSELKKEEYKAIDTSQLTQEEYGKLVKGETTIEKLIEEGRINV